MQIRFRPIHEWSGEHTRGRKASPFYSEWPATLNLIESELEKATLETFAMKVAP